MTAPIHWQIREIQHLLRQDGRLHILLQYALHANVRLRAWPSNDLMQRQTGYASAAVSAAKRWLIDHYAIVPVAYVHRVGEEKRLHQRKEIYQLTGAIWLTEADDKSFGKGAVIPYLHLNPEGLESIVFILEQLGKPLIIERLNFRSPKLSESEHEGNKRKTLKGSQDSAGGKGEDRTNPMYDAIKDVWQLEGALNGDFAKMLMGTATKAGFKEYNLNPPMTPDEVRKWAAWWKLGHPDLTMLQGHGKVYSSVVTWRKAGSPDTPKPKTPKKQYRQYKPGE